MHPYANAYCNPINKTAHNIAAKAISLLKRPKPMRVKPIVKFIIRLFGAIVKFAMAEIHMVNEKIGNLPAAGTSGKMQAC